MSAGIGSKLLSGLLAVFSFSTITTPHAGNAGFTKLNGSDKLFNGEWRDVIINGSALLGSPGFKTHFGGVIVSNGSAKVINASFNDLEINGNANLENTEVKNALHVNGKASLTDCTIERLIVYGKKTNVEVKNSIIRSKELIE